MQTQNLNYDVCVIGAGPAGLAAGAAAAKCGARVIIVEREQYTGGILPQCVHDGFGLHLFGRSLTGPEYADFWAREAVEALAELALGCNVLSAQVVESDPTFAINVIGQAFGGPAVIKSKALICATGCRERTRGQLGIAGTRPAGVMTAGSAQYMINVKNQLPGDKVVILGSGDIGLIMARRLTLEGAEVRMVLGQQATGLLRNHIRCIQDFDIPFREGWGIAKIHGTGQLKGVSVAPILPDGSFDMSQSQYIRANLLLLACGLIPELEAVKGIAPDTPNFFVCGNAQGAHDLVDEVTQEGLRVGVMAAGACACGGVAGAGAHGGVAGASVSVPEDYAAYLDMHIEEPKGHMSDLVNFAGVGTGAADAADVTEGAASAIERESAKAADKIVACTVCPTGCIVRVDASGQMCGNACARGEAYAKSELAHPVCTFTSTVKIASEQAKCSARLLPVRASHDIPREKLKDMARATKRIKVAPPVKIGQVVARDVAGTGADLIACASVK